MPPRISRSRGLRVRTGCLTCRRRHVKCDEKKPGCGNCSKKRRPCHYEFATTPESRVDNVLLQPSLPSPSSEPQPITRRLRSSALEVYSPDHELDSESHPAGCDASPGGEGEGTLETNAISSEANSLSSFLATLGSVLLDTDIVQRPHVHANIHTTIPTFRVEPIQEKTLPKKLCSDHPTQLTEAEITIFRNYVDNISHWIDSFSPDRPFHRIVPTLALQSPTLLHSCLALASKQLHLISKDTSMRDFYENEALKYYRLALCAIRAVLPHPHEAHRDEVLAACINLSTYEMIDVVGESLGSHLTGVASLLQSRQVTGDAGGIRGACYWTWYRHETWAALQTGRRMSLDEKYWTPPPLESYDHLGPEHIANRIIFIFGKCISFYNDQTVLYSTTSGRLRDYREEASDLERDLNLWKAKLPLSMTSFVTGEGDGVNDDSSRDQTAWFIYPQSAISNQVYHACRIILTLSGTLGKPTTRRLANCPYLSLRTQLQDSQAQILSTARSHVPGAWGLISAQCLYIAGLVMDGAKERNETLKLILECQEKTGRKTGSLASELRRQWGWDERPDSSRDAHATGLSS